MESRMERYRDSHDDNIGRRTKNNEDLYKTIYEMSDYSNIEGIANIPKSKSLDVSQVKQMLKSREKYQQEKKYEYLKSPEKEELEPVNETEEERNYDIRDILSKAKTERTEADNRYHSLKNTQYDILKNININDKIKKEDYIDVSDESLKNMINTITNTSMLNKLGDSELSMDLFSDLKSSGKTTVTNVDVIKKSLEEERSYTSSNDNIKDLDKSFYTSSMNFSKKDFEGIDDKKEDNNVSKHSKTNILVIVLFILVGAIIGYLIYMAVK